MIASIVIGMVIVVRFMVGVVSWFWSYFIRPGKNLQQTYGKFAVVTGATDGIGYCSRWPNFPD